MESILEKITEKKNMAGMFLLHWRNNLQLCQKKRTIYLTPQTAAFPSNSAFRLVSLDPNTGVHHNSENSHELSDSKSKLISVATRVQAPVFV